MFMGNNNGWQHCPKKKWSEHFWKSSYFTKQIKGGTYNVIAPSIVGNSKGLLTIFPLLDGLIRAHSNGRINVLINKFSFNHNTFNPFPLPTKPTQDNVLNLQELSPKQHLGERTRAPPTPL